MRPCYVVISLSFASPRSSEATSVVMMRKPGYAGRGRGRKPSKTAKALSRAPDLLGLPAACRWDQAARCSGCGIAAAGGQGGRAEQLSVGGRGRGQQAERAERLRLGVYCSESVWGEQLGWRSRLGFRTKEGGVK